MNKEKKISILEWSAGIVAIISFILGIFSASSPPLIDRWWFVVGIGLFLFLNGWRKKLEKNAKD